MMMRTAVWVAVVLTLAATVVVSAAQVWENARVSVATSPEEVTGVLGQAREEVLVATDVLRSRAVADGLRGAIRRGVRVLILTGRPGLMDRDGYLLGLLMAGAEVRLGTLTTRIAIVDGRLLIAGPHLSGIPAQETITIVTEAPGAARQARSRFLAAWKEGGVP